MKKSMESMAYPCLQPDYVGRFRCDGSQCGSKCCKNWAVNIDEETYRKYSGIAPQAAHEDILSHIAWEEFQGSRKPVVQLRDNGCCPFLRPDCLCELQKSYGEGYLSDTCTQYPRIAYQLNGMVERAMLLSCPVAARMVLLQREPMEFEMTDLEVERPGTLLQWKYENVPLEEHLLDIQYGCISLLQERSLTIPQRLIAVGFFLDHVQELEKTGKLDTLGSLARAYASEGCLKQLPALFRAVRFRPEDYIRNMFGLLRTLYGSDRNDFRERRDMEYLALVSEAYGLPEDAWGIPAHAMAAVYEQRCRPMERELLQKYGYIFEQWMVNEFFVNLYPFRVRGSLASNYEAFLMSCKLAEMVAVAMALKGTWNTMEDMLVDVLGFFSERIDHNMAYRNCITTEVLRQKQGVLEFMGAMLDGQTQQP